MTYVGENNTPRNMDQIINDQFRELINVIKRDASIDTNSWNDALGDDNCSFEKIMLTSLNFGLKAPRQIRSFLEELLTFASEPLLIFIADLISFWVDNHLQWIIADSWLYQQIIKVISTMQTQPAIDKALIVVSKLLRLDKIKHFAASETNMERVLEIQD